MTNEEFIESIRLDGEEWRDVVGWEGLYLVSSYGRVASLIGSKQRILCRQILTRRKLRYYTVLLHGKEKPKRKTVHRLVAIAFIPNPNGYPDIDHINRNGLDNRVENLRWCTKKMNMANKNTKKVLAVCHKGADHSYRFKPIVQIKSGVVINIYGSIKEAVDNGFSQTGISHACAGRKHTHQGYQWMYLNEYEKRKEQ